MSRVPSQSIALLEDDNLQRRLEPRVRKLTLGDIQIVVEASIMPRHALQLHRHLPVIKILVSLPEDGGDYARQTVPDLFPPSEVNCGKTCKNMLNHLMRNTLR
ncbi:predicted protein [Histoplasma capsulatum var. duboisii H88]|uniref:Predicted protein n=2 Tax=Ajellomyces capsulatus TaxID=5037 RepID=F0USH4_AJEC8|nr:predicted protein [Histoplasma capsulatum H143]EGC48851.1 predicted protein [Histoplasma capsulatum var. duboisii H88]